MFFGVVRVIWLFSDGQFFNWPARLAVENFVPSTIALSTYCSMVCCVAYASWVQVVGEGASADRLLDWSSDLADFAESCAALGLGIYLIEGLLNVLTPGFHVFPVRLSVIIFVIAGFFPHYVVCSVASMRFGATYTIREKAGSIASALLFVTFFTLILVFGIHPADACSVEYPPVALFMLC